MKRDQVPDNSSMAKDAEEVHILSKQMDKMKTNKELKKERDLDSDPKQEYR
ncbi:MAG: hypothetical protein ACI4XL_02975 [Bacillus sp. (in: firmicutes)]